MKKAKDYCFNILPDILKTESVASNCKKGIKILKNYLKKLDLKATETNKGALIIKIKGKNNKKTRLCTAHLDTLGAMVKGISGTGRVLISPIGAVSPFSVEGEYVTIETHSGKKFRGTILHNNPSVHVNREIGSVKRTFDNISIKLDEKVFNKKDVEKLGIETGNYCYFDTRLEVTESKFIKSRHLDDKAGVAAIFGALEYISRKQITPEYETWFYISVAEEVGFGTQSLLPDNCFEIAAVDMGALGEGQASDEFSVSICVKDSTGPFDYELRKKIVDICIKHKIPYKVDIYPYYGSDASAALATGLDAKHILFGPGVDASHSFERVHKDSLDATVELIIKYIQEK